MMNQSAIQHRCHLLGLFNYKTLTMVGAGLFSQSANSMSYARPDHMWVDICCNSSNSYGKAHDGMVKYLLNDICPEMYRWAIPWIILSLYEQGQGIIAAAMNSIVNGVSEEVASPFERVAEYLKAHPEAQKTLENMLNEQGLKSFL